MVSRKILQIFQIGQLCLQWAIAKAGRSCWSHDRKKGAMNTFNGKSLLTPKELAETLGASESSIRRWVDSGDIRIARTAGGHRRIPMAEAIRFIRQIGAPVVRPELLGLGKLPFNDVGGERLSDAEKIFRSLQSGDGEMIRDFLVSRYLEGNALCSLFDGPLLVAIRRVGDLWEHDERAILIEHRATGICIEAIGMLRRLLPPVREDSPLALGGAPQGDPYQLPSMMAGTVLMESGFRDVNFGANTPVELLGKEAIDRGARLVWLSISTPCEAKLLRASVKKLAADLGNHKIHLIVGGRNHLDYLPRKLPNVTSIQSMTELATLAADLLGRTKPRVEGEL
jgi:excisionase family DNA binding protein